MQPQLGADEEVCAVQCGVKQVVVVKPSPIGGGASLVADSVSGGATAVLASLPVPLREAAGKVDFLER